MKAFAMLAALLLPALAAGAPGDVLFVDDFEKHTAGQLPGAPWKEETYASGARIDIDGRHAFSGRQALHVLTPRGAHYRRGYVAIHLAGPLPGLQSRMFGRAMVWLDAVPGEAPVHWTLLQGEGRSADDRYNSIYRLGVLEQGGTGLMANFETTPPVKTDCRQQSTRRLPVRQWACVEWYFDAPSSSLRFWIDGREIANMKKGVADGATCKGDDLGRRWLAPPRFDSLYMGFERYVDTPQDQEIWIDDVMLSRGRVGCPKKP